VGAILLYYIFAMNCCGWGSCGDTSSTDTNKDKGYMLGLESMVPDLELQLYDPTKDDILHNRMSDYRGKRLVLFFYPADFTFVCPTELKDLSKRKKELEDLGARTLVVSTDTVFAHKRWVETEPLLKEFELSMISDRTWELSLLFGVLNEQSWNAERWTFIISPEWIIKSVEIVTEPIGRSSSELIRKVKALDYVRQHPGAACPASRDTDGKTLTPGIKIAGNVGKELE